MHALLQADGYPQVFAVGTSQLAKQLHAFIASDFDHLIINDRLLHLGYDARRGFLSKADSFDGVLKLSIPNTPDAQTVLIIGVLHELIKFHYYIGSPGAKEAILAKFPQARAY